MQAMCVNAIADFKLIQSNKTFKKNVTKSFLKNIGISTINY